jgi:hypothetical protein
MWILLHLFDPTAAILVNIFTDSHNVEPVRVFHKKELCAGELGTKTHKTIFLLYLNFNRTIKPAFPKS